MKLLFLDRSSLQYKDNAYVSNQFELALDMVIIKRSTFKVNKTNINCTIGDIVIFTGVILVVQTLMINRSRFSRNSVTFSKNLFKK